MIVATNKILKYAFFGEITGLCRIKPNSFNTLGPDPVALRMRIFLISSFTENEVHYKSFLQFSKITGTNEFSFLILN